jgi:hypothetical protein
MNSAPRPGLIPGIAPDSPRQHAAKDLVQLGIGSPLTSVVQTASAIAPWDNLRHAEYHGRMHSVLGPATIRTAADGRQSSQLAPHTQAVEHPAQGPGPEGEASASRMGWHGGPWAPLPGVAQAPPSASHMIPGYWAPYGPVGNAPAPQPGVYPNHNHLHPGQPACMPHDGMPYDGASSYGNGMLLVRMPDGQLNYVPTEGVPMTGHSAAVNMPPVYPTMMTPFSTGQSSATNEAPRGRRKRAANSEAAPAAQDEHVLDASAAVLDDSGEASGGKKARRRPRMSKQGWLREEDMQIVEYVQSSGPRWAEIATLLPGRTDDAVRNRYLRLIKKKEGGLNDAGRPRFGADGGPVADFTNDDLAQCS